MATGQVITFISLVLNAIMLKIDTNNGLYFVKFVKVDDLFTGFAKFL